MTPRTRYWLRRFRDGRIAALVRVRDEPGKGLWAEYFRTGEWFRDPSAISYLMDPLLGDEISREEAQAAVCELGQEWPDEPPGEEAHTVNSLDLTKKEVDSEKKERPRRKGLVLGDGPEF